MQHDAELPDIGGGGDRRGVQLFGRCVFEGQCAVAGGGGVAAFQLLGDAEVQQLHPALRIHQQVGGFQVAVDDQVAVRMRHRFQHLREQLHALAQVQLARVAPLVDGRAVDVFHDEVGIAFVAEAAVEQGGDVGMAQLRQQLAFAQETLACRRRIRRGADEFQCGPLRVRAIAAFDRVHRAHAAAADHLDDAPRAQLAAEHRLAGSREFVQRFTPSRGVATEWLALARIRRQHRAHFIEQVRIVATEFAQALFARLAVQVDHGIEGCHCPFLAFHRRFVHAAVSFIRNARARRQSRRRVLSLIASMSATSTSV